MSRNTWAPLLGCAVGAWAGCVGATLSPVAPDEAPASFSAQVELGRTLYAEQCASCHGDRGHGTDDGPRVVGLGLGALSREPAPDAVLRTGPFDLVSDVAGFVMVRMPYDSPGSLWPEEYWSILAFLLQENGLLLEHKLDPELAAQLPIPRP